MCPCVWNKVPESVATVIAPIDEAARNTDEAQPSISMKREAKRMTEGNDADMPSPVRMVDVQATASWKWMRKDIITNPVVVNAKHAHSINVGDNKMEAGIASHLPTPKAPYNADVMWAPLDFSSLKPFITKVDNKFIVVFSYPT